MKIKTTKISFGMSGGVSVKICILKHFPLYSMLGKFTYVGFHATFVQNGALSFTYFNEILQLTVKAVFYLRIHKIILHIHKLSFIYIVYYMNL